MVFKTFQRYTIFLKNGKKFGNNLSACRRKNGLNPLFEAFNMHFFVFNSTFFDLFYNFADN
jgi:hypothetical protein